VKRQYAGPLGKLARLLLWAYKDIELSEEEFGKCYASLITTMAMIRTARSIHNEKENTTNGATIQTELPWTTEVAVEEPGVGLHADRRDKR